VLRRPSSMFLDGTGLLGRHAGATQDRHRTVHA